MKLTKNVVVIASSLWTKYTIKKNLYTNVRIDMNPFTLLFACVRILMDPLPPPKCERNNCMSSLTVYVACKDFPILINF